MSALSSTVLPPSIILTNSEAHLFSFLSKVAESALESASTTTPIVLRVAGGWVRDKVLGLDSDDIDIALDTISGVAFAELCCSYLTSTSTSTSASSPLSTPASPNTQQQDKKKKPKFATIQSNPSQSKHLETATMNLFNYSIDFTNLRTETYSDSTGRIPQISFGTPEEDASRRDFTVNSLFYNITTSSLEDYTSGISDLKSGIIRTPLSPKLTFLDDPLRVLRGIRFSSRFNFTLSPSLITSIKDPEVRLALSTKVSKERVGKELSGCFKTPESGYQAFKLLTSLNLDEVIFTCPTGLTLSSSILPHVSRYVTVSSVSVRLLLMSSILLPNGRDVFEELQKNGRTYKSRSKVHYCVRDGIKWKSNDANDVQMLVEGVDEAVGLLKGEGRLEGGMFLRKFKELWRTGLALGAVKILDGGGEVEGMYEETVERIQGYNLEGCWKAKPLVDGKGLQEVLELGKGPEVGKWMKKVVEFMLVNEKGTKEECVEWLKKCKEQDMLEDEDGDIKV
ncbi:hypothetical protein TrVE_jg11544 [Triparma verrucosa]|uniref:Poly A polymerase head domain-containing protein n=1 Tax=Triparma verrucosa TaxID=1606542 RepID=A0A9W7BJC8_9STRA|nr:hypothetical protein TrVE_jg11544 [Triparma verrucosa]